MNAFVIKKSSIAIHILLWILFFSIVTFQFYLKFETIPKSFCYRSLTFLCVFYLNYAILVPKLLINNKTKLYITVAFAIFLLVVVVIEPLIPTPIKPWDLEIRNRLNRPFNPKRFRGFHPHTFSFVLITLLLFALSTSIRLVIEWHKKEKERVIIASHKINSELSFLKAQLNPHFLFNSLNSIYSLAYKKSDDATTAIITLSELMRYMIYEANENLVSLEKEIEYLKNYVSLQLLRLKDSSGVRININGELDYKIEPLLLITFIENAFKYGTDYKGKTDIRIKIIIKNHQLHLYTYNLISFSKVKTENSGIGLTNIKNRLNLLYPNNHQLTITESKQAYEVNLTLDLKK